MPHPTVFISYSHKDETEKNELLSHLGVLQQEGLLEFWVDDRISAGADWAAEIEQAIGQARVAILLITKNFLNSNFILNTEVPRLLARAEKEGLSIFPVIARPCAWQHVEWLARLNVRPKNGNPVWRSGGRYVDDELAKIAGEVYRIIGEAKTAATAPVQPTPPPAPLPLVHLHNWGLRPETFPAGAEVLDWAGPGLFEEGTPRRVPSPQVWQETLLPQLQALPAKLKVKDGVRLEGHCALSTGFAFGQIFRAITRSRLEVAQFSQGRGVEWWSTDLQPPPGQPAPALKAQTFPGSPTAQDGVVIINALNQVPSATLLDNVGTYFGEPGPFRQLPAGQAPETVKGVLLLEAEAATVEKRFLAGWETVALAGTSRWDVANFITQFQPQKLHLFLAAPLSLAVFLGYCWNRLNKPVQCYELVGGARFYAPTCEFILG